MLFDVVAQEIKVPFVTSILFDVVKVLCVQSSFGFYSCFFSSCGSLFLFENLVSILVQLDLVE